MGWKFYRMPVWFGLIAGTLTMAIKAATGQPFMTWWAWGASFGPLAVLVLMIAGGETNVYLNRRRERKHYEAKQAEDRRLMQETCTHSVVATKMGVLPWHTYQVSTYEECQRCGMIDPPRPVATTPDVWDVIRANVESTPGVSVPLEFGSRIHCDHQRLREYSVADMTTREVCTRCGERRWCGNDGVWLYTPIPDPFSATPPALPEEPEPVPPPTPVQPVAPVVHTRRPLNLDG